MIGHSGEHVSTALEVSGIVLYSTACDAFIALCDVRLKIQMVTMETHSIKVSNLKAT